MRRASRRQFSPNAILASGCRRRRERNSPASCFATALAEDIGSGDITAELVPAAQRVTGEVITREDATLCGHAPGGTASAGPKPSPISLREIGSSGWIRTSNPPVNSPQKAVIRSGHMRFCRTRSDQERSQEVGRYGFGNSSNNSSGSGPGCLDAVKRALSRSTIQTTMKPPRPRASYRNESSSSPSQRDPGERTGRGRA